MSMAASLAAMPTVLAIALVLARRPIVGFLLTRTPKTIAEVERRKRLGRGVGFLATFVGVIAAAGFSLAFTPAEAQEAVLIPATVIAIALNLAFVYFFRSAGLRWF